MKPSPLAAALATSLFAAAGAHAATPLSDAELSEIRGQDGSIVFPALPATADSHGGLGALAAAFGDPRGMSTLDAGQFAVSLSAAGYSTAMMAGYDGQPVKQYRISMAPATFSFGAAELLKAGTGLTYSGASMGTFTMTDFDASGTTVWSWTHH